LPKANPLAGWIDADLRVAAAPGNPISVGREQSRDVVLELRRVEPTDPPILSFLPLILRERSEEVGR
jgi:hypothetical protein